MFFVTEMKSFHGRGYAIIVITKKIACDKLKLRGKKRKKSRCKLQVGGKSREKLSY